MSPVRFYRSELGLMFRRRRNLALLVILALVPVLIAVAVKTQDADPHHDGIFGQITQNGIFAALAALLVSGPLFLPLVVSIVAGDAIAGEANTGTLRYLLAVPVGRSRLLAVKYVGLLVWSFACTLVVAVSGTIIGLIIFGGGD